MNHYTSTYIRHTLGRSKLDYLFITNADQDHMSDLDGLWQNRVEVGALYRNSSPTAQILKTIKEEQGELSDDINRYLSIHKDYWGPIPVPFDMGMGGVTCTSFCNSYPQFADTNNLSMVVFIKYQGFKMLFPGDLEAVGWRKLLERPDFLQELRGTDILVASHHGRLNGYCEDIFNYFTPQAVVISDKPIVHTTQEMVPDYRNVVNSNGVAVLNQERRRHVLTTRRDGDIAFKIYANGSFQIVTANA